jgi:putrescine transport system substrate-binding protein
LSDPAEVLGKETDMHARTAFLLAAAALFVANSASAEDKVVNVYNWSDYIADDTLANFTKDTGIKVTYDVYDSMETLEAKVYAGASGYDVIVPTNPNLQRMIQAGVLQPLDKSKLPNDKHQWKFISDRLAAYDPGNKYAEDYMWGTTGIGYNIDKIKAIMPDAPVDSWAMVFDPKIVSKFKSCGIYFLDSPDDVIPSMLAYLGLDPNSKNPDDLNKAGDALKAITPFVQKFHSSEYIDALANGDICMAIGYSGDVFQARDRADEADNGVHIAYSIPKEGALMWFDSMAVLKDAPHPENALAFINYMMDPKVAAANSDYVYYANGNLDSQKLLSEDVIGDPAIYPPQAVLDKTFTTTPPDQKFQRLWTRMWTSIKTGQ